MASDSKAIEMKPQPEPSAKEPRSGLSRETRLGMAVAGSFAVLVGGVFGVKQITGLGTDKSAISSEQVKLTDEHAVVNVPSPAFPEDPNAIKIDMTGLSIPAMPKKEVETAKSETLSLLPKMEMPSFDIPKVDNFNGVPQPTAKPTGISLAKFEEPKSIEPPMIPLPGGSGIEASKIEIPKMEIPKLDLKPIEPEKSDSTLPKMPSFEISKPESPESKPNGTPAPVTNLLPTAPEIKLAVPKIDLNAPPVEEIKINSDPNRPALPKMEPPKKDPINLEPAPINTGEGTITPRNTQPNFQPTSRSSEPDPFKIEMKNVEPQVEAPPTRTTSSVPAMTMENREPRTIPVVTAVGRSAKDYDEDLHEAKPGDNYAMISKKYYDDANFGTALAEYNRTNPTNNKAIRIPPLWVLEQNHAKAMPASNIRTTSMTAPANDRRDSAPPSADNREETKSSPFNGMRVYTVQRAGETLRSIAQNQLGNANYWKSLKDYNISVDENSELAPGTKLYLPGN